MIFLGALLLLQGFFSYGSLISGARHTAQVRQTVRFVKERMSREELSRLFDMPPETTDVQRWVAFYVGG